MSRTWFAAALFAVGCGPSFVAPVAPADLSRVEDAVGIDAYFCPTDDTVAVELAEIARVVDERRADPVTYPPGENPYAIRYAVYNLRNEPLVHALADARDAGVDVRIVMDADQLDPSRDWNWADDWLRDARGFSYAADHRLLTPAERLETELLGFAGAGLFHLKTRLFFTPTRHTLITGSMNPGDDAVRNDETFHLVHDTVIVDRYDRFVDALLLGTPVVNEWSGGGLDVLFNPESSGPDAGAQLLNWLRDEDEQILLMVFSLRDLTAPGVPGSLLTILGDKVKAGVPVVLVTDRNQSDGFPDTTEDRLRAAGVHVYEARNLATEFTAMHHKVAILGRTHLRVVTDAANWSKSGLGSASARAENQESTLFYDEAYDGGRMGRRYLAEFTRVLATYADQSAADGEPPFDVLGAELLSHPDWPAQDVVFAADRAETAWGETIHVVGDDPALGDWGRASLGVPLATDADLYPAWLADAPVTLPVGTPFAWKYVAVEGGSVARWESGDDRAERARPAPTGDLDLTQLVSGAFRD